MYLQVYTLRTFGKVVSKHCTSSMHLFVVLHIVVFSWHTLPFSLLALYLLTSAFARISLITRKYALKFTIGGVIA